MVIEQETRSLSTGALSDTSRATLGFVLSHEQFPVDRLAEFALLAEEQGFEALSTSDHFQPWQANEGHAGFAWVTLAVVGQRTKRIPFGTAVTCPSFRYNPAIVAQAFATLAQFNPGRVYLGVGTGEALNEVAAGGGWGTYEERAAQMIEAIQLIRELWTGEPVNHRGIFYQVKGRLYDPPPIKVPIYVAAGGPNTARLAGEHGDGLITDSASAIKPEMREAFEAGARAAGKDPGKMPIIAEHWVCTEPDEARKGAELWRFQPKAWTEFVDDPDPVDIMERARREVPIEQVVKQFVVSEDSTKHTAKLQELVDGGVTTILVHSAQEDQPGVIRFFGDEVLPKVRREKVATHAAH